MSSTTTEILLVVAASVRASEISVVALVIVGRLRAVASNVAHFTAVVALHLIERTGSVFITVIQVIMLIVVVIVSLTTVHEASAAVVVVGIVAVHLSSTTHATMAIIVAKTVASSSAPIVVSRVTLETATSLVHSAAIGSIVHVITLSVAGCVLTLLSI